MVSTAFGVVRNLLRLIVHLHCCPVSSLSMFLVGTAHDLPPSAFYLTCFRMYQSSSSASSPSCDWSTSYGLLTFCHQQQDSGTHSPSGYVTPSVSANCSMLFDNFSNGMGQMGYGGSPGQGMRFGDEETVSHLTRSMVGDDAVKHP